MCILPVLRVVQHAHTHTVARVCCLENYKRYFHSTTCLREVLSSSACMPNLDASAFYIALVLLHEYLHILKLHSCIVNTVAMLDHP